MGRFVLRRVAGMFAVLLAVSVLVFCIFNVIPNGDPADRMAGKNVTQTQVDAIEKEWGFDKSLPTQYFKTMEKVFTGNLISYENRTDVDEEIRKGFPRTLALSLGAAILWMGFGISLGLFSAVKAGALADRVLNVLAIVGISMPVFWVGALMNHYLGFKAGLFPNGGYVTIADGGILDWAYHLVLPSVALALLFIGIYSRVLRSNILDTMNDDYVRTARAKGISERRVLTRHVLRNSLIPIVTLFGLDFALIIGGGAVLTESVFDLQGVGQYFAEAIGRLDVPPVLAVTMFGAFFIVILNTLVDILYAALDPRIRVS